MRRPWKYIPPFVSIVVTVVVARYIALNWGHPQTVALMVGGVLLVIVTGILTYFIARLIEGETLFKIFKNRGARGAILVLLPSLFLAPCVPALHLQQSAQREPRNSGYLSCECDYQRPA